MPAVDEIMRRIEELSEEERLLLQERLTALLESEWRREAEAARNQARERGIDQTTIDRVIDEFRYGS